MIRTFAATTLFALACAMPLQQAKAQDAIAGGILGGAVGGLLGGALGGRAAARLPGRSSAAQPARRSPRRASAAPTAITGTTTAVISSAATAPGSQSRRNTAADRTMGRPPPRMALRPGHGPPPAAAAAVEDDEVEYIQPGAAQAGNADAAAACARKYRSYDPRTGTFLSLDGMRKPCPCTGRAVHDFQQNFSSIPFFARSGTKLRDILRHRSDRRAPSRRSP